jgi:hypothetical protein
MLKGKGRYWKTDGKFYIYVPTSLATDSQFPLKEKKGDVQIEIRDGVLIIDPSEKEISEK